MTGSIVPVSIVLVSVGRKERAANNYREISINFQHLQYINLPFTLVMSLDNSGLIKMTDI